MIIDHLSHAAQYYSVLPRLEKAFAFLETATRENYPVGRYELEGKELFAMVQEYESLPADGSRFEAHRNYVDVQYVVSGTEAIEVTELSKTRECDAYDSARDVAFFCDHSGKTRTVLTAGEWGLFFPHDVHKPGLAPDGTPAHVKKIVVKIRL